jgi:hypothetical protein
LVLAITDTVNDMVIPPNTLAGLRLAFGQIADYVDSRDINPHIGVLGAKTLIMALIDAAASTMVKRTKGDTVLTTFVNDNWNKLLQDLLRP